MKNTVNSHLAYLFLILAFGISSVQGAPNSFHLPEHAVKVAQGIYSLGYTKHKGKIVKGYAIVHPYRNLAKPDNPGNGNGGQKKDQGGSTCFAFIGNGANWKTAESYIIDSSNAAGMSDSFVSSTINKVINDWNTEAATTIFNQRVAGSVDGADSVAPDNKNEVYFAGIEEENVIAVTIVWGIFGGPPSNRELVEWDQVYDDEEFGWGDATTNTSIMDFHNIAAHEIGHAAGMGHPDDTCTEETMFAYAETGEIKKRDLFDGDITGIKKLYK